MFFMFLRVLKKKNRTRMLKSLSILEKVHPDDTNVFAPDIIENMKINQIICVHYA